MILMPISNFFPMTLARVLFLLQTLNLSLFCLLTSIDYFGIMLFYLLKILLCLIFIRFLWNFLISNVLGLHFLLIMNWVKGIVLVRGLLRWGLWCGLFVVFAFTAADNVHDRSDFESWECVQFVGYWNFKLFLNFAFELLDGPTVIHFVFFLFSQVISFLIVLTLQAFLNVFTPPSRAFTKLLTGQLLQLRIKRLLHSAVEERHALWDQRIVFLEKQRIVDCVFYVCFWKVVLMLHKLERYFYWWKFRIWDGLIF